MHALPRFSADLWQFYRPWELRPDEEDRIDEQIKEAQAQIDKELHEHGEELRPVASADERDTGVFLLPMNFLCR